MTHPYLVMLSLDGSDLIPVAGDPVLMAGAVPMPVFKDHLPQPGDFFEMAGVAYEITKRTWAPGGGYIRIEAESIATEVKGG